MAARVVVRCDASPAIGGGHAVRCLALADALAERGAEILLCTNPEAVDTVPALAAARHARAVVERPDTRPLDGPFARPDLVIADHYGLDAAGFARLAAGAPLAVIDDLADRDLPATYIVNPNLGRSAADYAGHVPDGARVLAGADYALLRPDFARLRAGSLVRRAGAQAVERVLVSLGLTDPDALAARVVARVRRALPAVTVEAIVGAGAPSRPLLEARARDDARLALGIDVADMAARLARADLAIGAPGGSALERCVLGVPSVLLVLADNQVPAAATLARIGAARLAADADAALDVAVRALAEDPAARIDTSRRAAAACDGLGAARVAETLVREFGPAGAA